MNENKYIRDTIKTALAGLQSFDSDLEIKEQFVNDNTRIWVAFDVLQDVTTDLDYDATGHPYYETHEVTGAIYLKHSVKPQADVNKELQDNNGLWQSRIKKVIRGLELPKSTTYNDGSDVYEITITTAYIQNVNYIADSVDNYGMLRNEIKLIYNITEI